MAELNSTSLLADANLQFYSRIENNYTDLSANVYSLADTNTPIFVTGKFGQAINLAAALSQYAYLASVPNLRIAGDQSWGCWFKPNSNSTTQRIMALSDTGFTNYVSISLDGVSFAMELSGLTPTNKHHSLVVTAGNWYHVVGVYDATAHTITIYVNGAGESTSVTGSHTAGSGGFAIGRFGDSISGSYANGAVDDPFIFNRTLSQAEVNLLYEGVSPSSSISPSISPSSSISASRSPSSSLSPSISPSASRSPSASASPSSSISASISPSSSQSPSSSNSPSPSKSPSSSISPSPSLGSSLFSKGSLSSLPSNTNSLSLYTDAEEITVETEDSDYATQEGTRNYMIHLFKSFVGTQTDCTIEWVGKSTLSPELSAITMQLYNVSTGSWETVDSNTTGEENQDIVLTTTIAIANYKDALNLINCRIYQLGI